MFIQTDEKQYSRIFINVSHFVLACKLFFFKPNNHNNDSPEREQTLLFFVV